jgi:hypothetical protein
MLCKSSMEESCRNIISYNFLIRTGLTILSFSALYKYPIKENLLLILPILLTALDFSDNILSHPTKKCAHTFFYQGKDKLIDLLSYIAAWKIFLPDPTLLYFILWRSLGVILFSFTRQSIWLVVFFDFVKEYMLYSYFFKSFTYLPIAILLKIVYEYIMHTITLPSSY